LLTELGRLDESRNEFETLIRDYPEDSWAYKKLADSYWREGADEPTAEDLERAVKLYEQALNAEGSLEQPSTVSERIDELERRLANMDTSEMQENRWPLSTDAHREPSTFVIRQSHPPS